MNITGKTQLIGLMGWPVGHSQSPEMHNAAATALDLNWVYIPLLVDPETIETAVRGLPALGFRGVNVTIPHKEAVMDYLDAIDPAARAIGAVNTIVIDDMGDGPVQLTGHNTDGAGFLADLAALNVPVAGRDCIVLGAGGSARAIVYALASQGATVYIASRRLSQSQHIAVAIRRHFPEATLHPLLLAAVSVPISKSDAPLVVNTTPVGMPPYADVSLWPKGLPYPDGTFIYDLVYTPAETKLLQQARKAGVATANGLGMLVEQGAAAFALWTGKQPDTAVMRAAISRDRQPQEKTA